MFLYLNTVTAEFKVYKFVISFLSLSISLSLKKLHFIYISNEITTVKQTIPEFASQGFIQMQGQGYKKRTEYMKTVGLKAKG